MHRPRFLALTASVLALSVACSGNDDANSQRAGGDSASAGTTSPSGVAELTKETLTAYERGMRTEIEAVRAATQRSRDAKTAEERGNAIQASFEDATIAQGAEAAGMPVEQYRSVRETVNEIFQTLDFQGKIDGPLSMDLSRVDEATRQRLARDPFEKLSPASANALRAEMDRLVPIWIDYVLLTAVAG
jgi:hypothetical protein